VKKILIEVCDFNTTFMIRLFFAMFLICSLSYSQTDCDIDLSTEDIVEMSNKKINICGKVEEVTTVGVVMGEPTFLNLNGLYPNQKITLIIWQSNLFKFKQGVDYFLQKKVRVTGKVESYRGKLQIIINEPSEIIVLD